MAARLSFNRLGWVLLLTVLIAPCVKAAERVIFHPGWFISPQFAGILVALDRGFYREAGLEVEIRPFAYGLNSPALSDATPEICALGTIEGYILLQKRNAGTDLKALAAMLQESPAGYMTLASSKIDRVQDFSGRRVGVHKFADKIFHWFAQQAGLGPNDTRMIFVEDDVTLLTRGELDVMQGYASEEFVRLQNLTDGAGRFISFASLGFPSYSEILYTTASQADRHEATVRRFVTATRRGWSYAFAHPDETVKSLLARQGTEAEATHLRDALTALEAYVRPGGSEPMAPMDAAKWVVIQKAGVEIGLVRETEPVETFLLNW